MNKESWYASKLSDMDVVRISESNDWTVDYDKERGMYRVSYFEDNHFVDEHWFDAYEEELVEEVSAVRNFSCPADCGTYCTMCWEHSESDEE